MNTIKYKNYQNQSKNYFHSKLANISYHLMNCFNSEIYA